MTETTTIDKLRVSESQIKRDLTAEFEAAVIVMKSHNEHREFIELSDNIISLIVSEISEQVKFQRFAKTAIRHVANILASIYPGTNNIIDGVYSLGVYSKESMTPANKLLHPNEVSAIKYSIIYNVHEDPTASLDIYDLKNDDDNLSLIIQAVIRNEINKTHIPLQTFRDAAKLLMTLDGDLFFDNDNKPYAFDDPHHPLQDTVVVRSNKNFLAYSFGGGLIGLSDWALREGEGKNQFHTELSFAFFHEKLHIIIEEVSRINRLETTKRKNRFTEIMITALEKLTGKEAGLDINDCILSVYEVGSRALVSILEKLKNTDQFDWLSNYKELLSMAYKGDFEPIIKMYVDLPDTEIDENVLRIHLNSFKDGTYYEGEGKVENDDDFFDRQIALRYKSIQLGLEPRDLEFEEAIKEKLELSTQDLDEIIKKLPPLEKDWVRLTHFTHKSIAEKIILDDFSYSSDIITSTTDIFTNNTDLKDTIETSQVGTFSRSQFGNCIILMDIEKDEYKKRFHVGSQNSTIPNTNIIGYIITSEKDGEKSYKLIQNPNYTPEITEVTIKTGIGGKKMHIPEQVSSEYHYENEDENDVW